MLYGAASWCRFRCDSTPLSAQVYFHLNEFAADRLAIVNAVSAPYFLMGTTNTAAALRLMREDMFTSENGKRSLRRHRRVLRRSASSNMLQRLKCKRSTFTLFCPCVAVALEDK